MDLLSYSYPDCDWSNLQRFDSFSDKTFLHLFTVVLGTSTFEISSFFTDSVDQKPSMAKWLL